MIDVSTTSTNIAIASRMASRRFKGGSLVLLTRSASVTEPLRVEDLGVLGALLDIAILHHTSL
jgi:hypothetical protein